MSEVKTDSYLVDEELANSPNELLNQLASYMRTYDELMGRRDALRQQRGDI
jgi:hypothetical protein